jgi:hypothetical protein
VGIDVESSMFISMVVGVCPGFRAAMLRAKRLMCQHREMRLGVWWEGRGGLEDASGNTIGVGLGGGRKETIEDQ